MSDGDDRWLGLPRETRPVVVAGTLLGLGLGGFFDGIVFHQILQWHHMLSAHPDAAVAGDLELNVLFDGLFHALTYLFTVAGVVVLWRAWNRPAVPIPGRSLFGSILLGWGLFNILEGTVNHFLLGIHHVWPDGPGSILLWDVAFLVWGGLFVVVGYVAARNAGSGRAVESQRT